MKTNKKIVGLVTQIVVILLLSFSAQAYEQSTLIEINIVKIQRLENSLSIEYLDESGNVRIVRNVSVFGNFQSYSYVSSNGSVFPKQSWYCSESGTEWNSPNELSRSNVQMCGNSVVSQLKIYSPSISETCPLPITIEVSGVGAKIKKIRPQACHSN